MPSERTAAWGLGALITVASAFVVLTEGDIDASPWVWRLQRLYILSHPVDAYAADTGHLPSALSALLSSNEPGWNGPYAEAILLRDVDGIDVNYAIVDARTRTYRLSVPGHETKAGVWVAAVRLMRNARLGH